MRTHRLAAIFAGTVIVLLVTVLMITRIQAGKASTSDSSGGIFIPSWMAQPAQVSSIGKTANLFAVQGALILPKEIQIYYVLQPTQKTNVTVKASSCVFEACSDLAAASVRSLGSLGGKYDVGVIDVPWTDRVGQTIKLDVATADKASAWTVTPLQQQAAALDHNSISYLSFSDGPNDVHFEQGIMGGPLVDATFKVSLDSALAAPTNMLFLSVDQRGTPALITAVEYSTLNSDHASTAPNSADPNAPPTSTAAPLQP